MTRHISGITRHCYHLLRGLLLSSIILAGCGSTQGTQNPDSVDSQRNAGSGDAATRQCPPPRAAGGAMDAPPVLQPFSPAPAIELELVADGFELPLHVASANDGSGRLFVVEKAGRVQILRQRQRTPQPFLDIRHLVESTASERGLLSIAFHPDYAENGFFFVNYTDLNGDTVIARYQVSADADVADPESGSVVLAFAQPAANHNGGGLAFGPDGYLYIGTGDGGRAGDPWNNAQSCDTLLGKMLRIDVSTAQDRNGGTAYTIPPDNPFADEDEQTRRPEIWAWGLRNPWRYTFDRTTGDLYIGDVGQDIYEEIHYLPATDAGIPPDGGQNYGWNIMEGTHCYPEERACDRQGLEQPLLDYAHRDGCSVTGGGVYRGSAFPTLAGLYLYGDYCSGKVWGVRSSDGVWQQGLLLETGLSISSFGADEQGEVYLTDIGGGGVYKIVQ